MKKFLANIQLGLRNNMTSMYVQGNKKILVILQLLEQEGVIRGFQILDIKTFKICIFFKYKENLMPLISRISSISETKERIYYKGKYIKHQSKNTFNIQYISNQLGLLPLVKLSQENKKLGVNLGGELKYLIEFNKASKHFKEQIKK